MTRSAYVQVRCAVVALWSERHQRYAAKTGPETSNLTQNYGFAGSSFLGMQRVRAVTLIPSDRAAKIPDGETTRSGRLRGRLP